MGNCSKSGVYVASQTPTAVTAGNIIPIGTVQRSYGCDVKLNGNTIVVCGKEKAFKVQAVLTLSAASTDPITVTLQQDGVAVEGATSTITVAGTSDQTVLSVQGVVKNFCDCASTLSFVLTGADATIDVDSIIVESWGC